MCICFAIIATYTWHLCTSDHDCFVNWNMKLDYERGGQDWKKIIRSSPVDWSKNVETIVQWSPFSSEADLLCQVTLYTSCVAI